MPRLEVLESRTVLSTLTVLNNNDSGPGSLRQAILDAPSGSTIKFANHLQGGGTITLSQELVINKNLDIEGPGASKLTISGNDKTRVFDIEGGPFIVTIAGLTITHGRADGTTNHPGIGGGIYHLDGTLTLSHVVLSNSQAIGSVTSNDPTFPGHIGGGFAGGVFNQDGTLNIAHSTLIGNESHGADGGTGAVNTTVGDAEGGCINNAAVNANAYLSITDSSLIANQAIAGNGSAGSVDATPGFFGIVNLAVGGGIMNFFYAFGGKMLSASASVTNCQLIDNEVVGGNNSTGGNASRDIVGVASGGAILNDTNDVLVINNSRLTGNRAIGGSGGTPGTGIVQQVDVGEGAGIGNLGTVFVNGDRFTNNTAIGGAGGDGLGGGLASILGVGTGTVTKSSFERNIAQGGAGGNGLGGGLYNDRNGDTITVIASPITQNQATGGAGGEGIGGGVFNSGMFNPIGNQTNLIKHNHASTSNPDIFTT
ncbi:MAG: hypothetical protein JOZ49_18100 [Mycolicibacterium sp.]|nr:hypothetical protein [Mycolicibacterium sp.]